MMRQISPTPKRLSRTCSPIQNESTFLCKKGLIHLCLPLYVALCWGGLLISSVGLIGCTAEEGDQVVDMGPPKKPRDRPPYQDDPWFEKFSIEGGGMGLHARLKTSPSGVIGVAYWSTDGTEGELCEGIEVDDPPLEVRWSLKYARWRETEGWDVRAVADPLLLGLPPGLDLSYSDSGTPLVFAISGEPDADIRYCGGNDLGLFTPANDPEDPWEVQWVVEESDQAMSGDQASDYGTVVGYWPSVAYGPSGERMVVYQDVHGGSLQRDDLG